MLATHFIEVYKCNGKSETYNGPCQVIECLADHLEKTSQLIVLETVAVWKITPVIKFSIN